MDLLCDILLTIVSEIATKLRKELWTTPNIQFKVSSFC